MVDIYGLEGKTALVTGATGNLGRRICTSLSELGVNLILTDIDDDKLESFAGLLNKKFNIKIQYYSSHLGDFISRKKLIEKVLAENKSLDILINNAAYVSARDDDGWATTFDNQSLETWNSALEINLNAPFHLCQKLYPLLKKSEGSIINLGSIYGVFAPDWSLYENTRMSNVAAYGVSKAGLIYLTKWLSKTISPEVRVNSISPGGVFRGQDSEFVKKYEKRTSLNRMANEDDIVGSIIFLCSKKMSSYITGQNIVVDGGWGI
jgi:NAD(P)-dependent dehydrogenase (short-subunit alcohol dehydrogenase family)